MHFCAASIPTEASLSNPKTRGRAGRTPSPEIASRCGRASAAQDGSRAPVEALAAIASRNGTDKTDKTLPRVVLSVLSVPFWGVFRKILSRSGNDQEREGPDDNGVADHDGWMWVHGGTVPMPPERTKTRRVRRNARRS